MRREPGPGRHAHIRALPACWHREGGRGAPGRLPSSPPVCLRPTRLRRHCRNQRGQQRRRQWLLRLRAAHAEAARVPGHAGRYRQHVTAGATVQAATATIGATNWGLFSGTQVGGAGSSNYTSAARRRIFETGRISSRAFRCSFCRPGSFQPGLFPGSRGQQTGKEAGRIT